MATRIEWRRIPDRQHTGSVELRAVTGTPFLYVHPRDQADDPPAATPPPGSSTTATPRTLPTSRTRPATSTPSCGPTPAAAAPAGAAEHRIGYASTGYSIGGGRSRFVAWGEVAFTITGPDDAVLVEPPGDGVVAPVVLPGEEDDGD